MYGRTGYYTGHFCFERYAKNEILRVRNSCGMWHFYTRYESSGTFDTEDKHFFISVRLFLNVRFLVYGWACSFIWSEKWKHSHKFSYGKEWLILWIFRWFPRILFKFWWIKNEFNWIILVNHISTPFESLPSNKAYDNHDYFCTSWFWNRPLSRRLRLYIDR